MYIFKKSEKGSSLYIGLTINVRKRLNDHNQGLSNYTKGHIPYKLIFISYFPSKFIATKFEKYLKTASGKAFINKRLISKQVYTS